MCRTVPTDPDLFWKSARAALAGLPNGGLNIAYEALDRHVLAGRGDNIALRWLDKAGMPHDFSYATLLRLSHQFAHVLQQWGVEKGDRVCILTGRIPALYITALGTLKAGAVFCPLFSAFGPDPLRVRLNSSRATVLVTTSTLYDRKIRPQRDQLTSLERVLLTDKTTENRASDTNTIGRNTKTIGEEEGLLSFDDLLAGAPDRFTADTQPEDAALLHFTSGTTGTPKGAVHVHNAVVAHHSTAQTVFRLQPGDVYWCTADPGWVTGVSYGIIAPLVHGVTLIADEAEFDARRWYQILSQQRVNVWYTAPTAIRLLMKVGAPEVGMYDFSALRCAASVGEPLHPEGVLWGERTFGQPFRDTWWQTETGAILIANQPDYPVQPGAMGKAMPGITAAVVQRTADGRVLPLPVGTEGELAIQTPWPSLFHGYLDDPARTSQCFTDGWYITGDLAQQDAEGCFWFLGRADDVIKTAGHLVGPFEVEQVFLEHPAVAEAGMIGMPDPIAGHIVHVFIVPKPPHTATDSLRKELLGFGRSRLGPAVAPRELAFLPDLPKTRSGKILRRLLKAYALGDLSALAGNVEQQ